MIAAGAALAATLAWWATGEIAVVISIAAVAAAMAFAMPAPSPPPRVEPPVVPPAAATDDGVSIESLADPALLVDGASSIVAANAAARALIGERAAGEGLAVALRHPAALDAVRLVREHGTPVVREIAGVGRNEGLYRLRVTALGRDRLLLLLSDISAARLAERMRVD
ncbi:MAG: hypothetical protein C0489_11045, partial [Candidatus Accumulibacter sp.]|nr:hypothetical protein [Accumulibacter sp.]